MSCSTTKLGPSRWASAAERAGELLAAGDHEGCAVWKRIIAAVKELERTKPADDERVN